MPIPAKEKMPAPLSAKEKIYLELSQWIMNGTLEPGEKINEAEIAEYFAVSRTPVREALQLLSEQKLIDIFPSKGSFVSTITRESARPIYEALAAVSCYIIRLACAKRSDKDIAELTARNEAFKKAYRAGQYGKLPSLDTAFHQYIGDIANNAYLTQMQNSLMIHASRIEILYSEKISDREQSIQEHECIIHAIEERNILEGVKVAEDNWLGIFEKHIAPLLE